MTDDRRFSFTELWEGVDREFVAAKYSQGALLAISSIYRRATPARQMPKSLTGFSLKTTDSASTRAS
jgi:hypothetical protein